MLPISVAAFVETKEESHIQSEGGCPSRELYVAYLSTFLQH